MIATPPPRPAALTEHRVRTADGRYLSALSIGAGPDLVVLEAGLGSGALSWGTVMEHLAPHVRVLAYDRAGYGSSDPDQRPRDLARLADDLVRLCGSFRHERLILVGHSWGGPICRVAAARLGTLRGMVLVDPSDEHAELYFSRGMRVQAAVQGRLLGALARIGLLRPLMRVQVASLPERYRDGAADAVSSPSAARSMRAENDRVVRGLQLLRLHPAALSDVPLTLISGRRAGRLDRAVRDQLTDAHAASARAHTRGRLVEAHESGHMVPFTQPELVADEILALLSDDPGLLPRNGGAHGR